MSIQLVVQETTNGLTLSQTTYALELSSGTSPSAQEGAGSPVGIITPSFKGQLYFDTNQYGSVYAANGLTNTSWVELVRNF